MVVAGDALTTALPTLAQGCGSSFEAVQFIAL
jgi:hypothetical protein